MPTLTLLDAFILLAVVGSVLSACHRGLGKEMLHTMMFLVMVGAGLFFLRGNEMPETQAALAQFVINCAFYLVAMYVFMWGAMKFVGPLILKEGPVGFRSRFWAGALSVAKLLAIILGVNLWYAIESPYAHPLRLEAFPQMVQGSAFVQLSDRTTDEIYRWLAAENVLNYEKVLEKPATAEGKDDYNLEGLLGGKLPPAR